jgi:hypothetical protein
MAGVPSARPESTPSGDYQSRSLTAWVSESCRRMVLPRSRSDLARLRRAGVAGCVERLRQASSEAVSTV